MSAGKPPAEASGFGPLAAIRREFPGWHPWRSSAGRFWATRIMHRRRPADADHTWAMTVDGDTAAKLREAIAEQEEHAPSELAVAAKTTETDPDG